MIYGYVMPKPDAQQFFGQKNNLFKSITAENRLLMVNRFQQCQKRFSEANWLPAWIRYKWQDPYYFEMLHLLCLDDYSAVLRTGKLDASWIQIALYLPANQLCTQWFNEHPYFAKYFLNSALSAGNLPMVNYLLERFPARLTKEHFTLALNSGNVDLVDFLLQQSIQDIDYSLVCYEASSLKLVKLLYQHQKAQGGNLSSVDEFALDSLESGDPELFDYLHQRGFPAKKLFARFYYSGNVEAVSKIVKEHNDCSLEMIDLGILAEAGKVELYAHCLNHGKSIEPYHFNLACQIGHVRLLRFLLDKNCLVRAKSLHLAQNSGHRIIIDLLLERSNLSENETSIARAYQTGAMDVRIAFLYLYRPLLNSRPEIYAEILKKLIPLPLTGGEKRLHQETLEYAVQMGHLGLQFEYLELHSCQEIFLPFDLSYNSRRRWGDIAKAAEFSRHLNTSKDGFWKTDTIPSLLQAIDMGLAADAYHCLIFAKRLLQNQSIPFLKAVHHQAKPPELRKILQFLIQKKTWMNDLQIPDVLRCAWQNPQEEQCLSRLSNEEFSREEIKTASFLTFTAALYMQKNNFCQQWIKEHNADLETVTEAAAEAGNLFILKSISQSQKFTPSNKLLAKAIHSGEVNLVQWLLQSFPQCCIDTRILNLKSYTKSSIQLIDLLASYRNTPQWQLSEEEFFTFKRLSLQCGDQNILSRLEGISWSLEDVNNVCAAGKTPLLDLVISKQEPSWKGRIKAFEASACYGHIELFDHYRHSCDLTPLFTEAAKHGHRLYIHHLLGNIYERGFSFNKTEQALKAAKESVHPLLWDDVSIFFEEEKTDTETECHFAISPN